MTLFHFNCFTFIVLMAVGFFFFLPPFGVSLEYFFTLLCQFAKPLGCVSMIEVALEPSILQQRESFVTRLVFLPFCGAFGLRGMVQ